MTQTPLYNVSRGADSYKFTQWPQYPPGTTQVGSHFCARKGKEGWAPETVFFGLQYFLKRYCEGVVVTARQVERSRRMAKAHFGDDALFNYNGWMHIVNKHKGHLPLRIKAITEGTVVPTGNALITVEATDPECYWLTNWMETLLVQVWGMSTVATGSRECKKIITKYRSETGTVDPGIKFALHDFGYRGVDCVESAATLGAAHLVNFSGTDTFAAIDMLDEYYNPRGLEIEEFMPGFSIPASEHSTVTSWGKDKEKECFANMLSLFPKGPMACVSDSYDIIRAISQYWGRDLREVIMAREGGPLVIRPDSGELPGILLEVFDASFGAFGYETNDKGYKVLPPQVRIIQGDGIDRDMIITVLEALKAKGISADNLAFGSGGGLLQKWNRDDFSHAFKCNYAIVDGVEREVYKDPVTDPGKRSLKGRLKVVKLDNGELVTVGDEAPGLDQLQLVFQDGALFDEQQHSDIVERAEIPELQ